MNKCFLYPRLDSNSRTSQALTGGLRVSSSDIPTFPIQQRLSLAADIFLLYYGFLSIILRWSITDLTDQRQPPMHFPVHRCSAVTKCTFPYVQYLLLNTTTSTIIQNVPQNQLPRKSGRGIAKKVICAGSSRIHGYLSLVTHVSNCASPLCAECQELWASEVSAWWFNCGGTRLSPYHLYVGSPEIEAFSFAMSQWSDDASSIQAYP